MPIFCNFNIFFDINKNKYYFGIFLFKFIKLYGGYFQFFKGGIVFHLSEQKALILPLKKVFENRNKFEITKGFEIIRYHQVIEYGDKEDLEKPVYLCSLTQIIFGIIYGRTKSNKPFVNLKSTTLLVEEESILKISANIVAAFNMIVLIMAFSKIFLERILKNVKRKRYKNR
jgi:hypothetical protein